MTTRYKTGSKEKVIRMMCWHAVQDREALIDAISVPGMTEDDKREVAEIEEVIADYYRLEKTLLKIV